MLDYGVRHVLLRPDQGAARHARRRGRPPVTPTEHTAPPLRGAFYVAASGRPGPVLVDITKDAQVGKTEYAPSNEPIRLRGYLPDLRGLPEEVERAPEFTA